jgi:helicase
MRDSTLDVLVATSTLELGVNLPVRQVVLYDTHQFDGSVFQPISVNAAWQRAGRAGRPGLDEEGEVVVLAARWDRELDQLSRGRFEPVMSALDSPSALAEQIVVEVYSDLARTNDQLERALAQSLAAHQGRLPPLLPAVASMKDAGLLAEVIDETGLRLKATQLGRVASRHMLTPASVLTLKAVLDLVSEPTFFDILIACASTPDCEPVLSVDYEELPSLAERLTSEPSHLLASPDTRVSLGIDGRRLLSALKMALVLRQWTRIGEEDDVATRFGCYPFEISALRESAERLLQALSAMVPSTDGDGARRSCAKVHALTTMIKAGLDEEMVTLALVPGIGPALARRLAAMGVSDIEALACSDAEAISSVRGVSRTRAMSWIAQAETLVGEVSAFEYREDRGPQIVTAEAWPPDVELYRFRRALDLVVEATGDDYRVSGGLDPHIIDGATLQCDCPDAAAGNACKHRLAVRLYKGDRRLRSLRRRLVRDGGLKDKRPVDLARLWLADGGAQYRSKVG